MPDFYLISQSSRQGTVNRVHYKVLYNKVKEFSAEYIQRLSYKLCHMYYNWTVSTTPTAIYDFFAFDNC